MNLRRIDRTVQAAGFALIVLVDGWGAIPRMYTRFYKGIRHQEGSDVVAVYAAQDEDRGMLVPVQDPNVMPGSHKETGEHVLVFVNNSYKDDIINYYPRVTLVVVTIMLILKMLLGRAQRVAL